MWHFAESISLIPDSLGREGCTDVSSAVLAENTHAGHARRLWFLLNHVQLAPELPGTILSGGFSCAQCLSMSEYIAALDSSLGSHLYLCVFSRRKPFCECVLHDLKVMMKFI